MTTVWVMFHPHITLAHLGFIPEWLSESDPDPAYLQIHKHYAHGGGWFSARNNPRQRIDPRTYTMYYPGDPPQRPLALTHLRDETIIFYPHAFVAIVQKDGSWDIARID